MITTKSMNQFLIYAVASDGSSVEIERFESETNERAIETVDSLRNDPNYKGMIIRWRFLHHIGILDENGKEEKVYETHEEHMKAIRDKLNSRPVWKKVWSWICHKFYKVWDFRWEVKYAWDRVVTGYDSRDSWNINTALFKFLIHNADKMANNLNGCPDKYARLARKMLNPLMTDKELEESYQKNQNSTNKEVEVGCALWKSTLKGLVSDCKEYFFYEDYGILDEKDEDSDISYKWSIPMLKNSSEIDYKELSRKKGEVLDRIFKTLRDDFECLWD